MVSKQGANNTIRDGSGQNSTMYVSAKTWGIFLDSFNQSDILWQHYLLKIPLFSYHDFS